MADVPPTDDEPSCCELACYEDPGCACEGCGGSHAEPHVTPVGGWLLVAAVVLVTAAAVAWKVLS
jgi:hypothetical protein